MDTISSGNHLIGIGHRNTLPMDRYREGLMKEMLWGEPFRTVKMYQIQKE